MRGQPERQSQPCRPVPGMGNPLFQASPTQAHSALLALPYLILVSNAKFPEENSGDRFSTAATSILVVAITDF